MRSKQVFATGPDAGTPLHNPQPEQRRPGILTRKRNSNIKSNPISSRLSSTSKAAASRPRRVAPSTSSNDVTIQGDNVVYVTAHTDQEDTLRSGESGTAVLIPVMLVGSGKIRFFYCSNLKIILLYVSRLFQLNIRYYKLWLMIRWTKVWGSAEDCGCSRSPDGCGGEWAGTHGSSIDGKWLNTFHRF